MNPLAFLLAVLSALAFALAAWDKFQAGRGGRRVPERLLLLAALVGGSPGLVLAMVVFRHKTRKAGFLAPLAAILLVQAAVAAYVLKQP